MYEQIIRDEDIANGRDIDDLSLERHNKRLNICIGLKTNLSCYGRSVGRHPLGRPS